MPRKGCRLLIGHAADIASGTDQSETAELLRILFFPRFWMVLTFGDSGGIGFFFLPGLSFGNEAITSVYFIVALS